MEKSGMHIDLNHYILIWQKEVIQTGLEGHVGK